MNLLSRLWSRFRDTLYRVADPLVDRLIHTRPLPEWTNADLFVWGCAIWAYAIALNWYADSLTFVVTGAGVLALWGAVIFGRVEWERGHQLS